MVCPTNHAHVVGTPPIGNPSGALGVYVCSEFQQNIGILIKANFVKSRNRGVSYMIFLENTQKGYVFKPPMPRLHFKPISV